MSDREASLRQAVERQPANANAHSELAAHCFSSGQLDDAVRAFARACELAPGVQESYYNLAAALNASGDPYAALDVIEQAVERFPDSALIHYGKACVLQSLGRPDDALATFTASLDLEPNNADAWYGVGVLLLRQGDPRRAGSFFERALDAEPEHPGATYMRDALSGEARTRPDAAFVRELFDSYAAYYDDHMLGTLGYRVPDLLSDAVANHLGGTPVANALDLGCGTGLLGGWLRTATEQLVGVDLAESMLDKARTLECYDQLECADVLDYLKAADAATQNLVVAADLFIYFAELDEAFAEIRRVLSPDGLFAFTVEEDRGDGWSVAPSGRFRHSRGYLDTLCDELGFSARSFERTALRHDAGEPCQGFVVVWSAGRAISRTVL